MADRVQCPKCGFYRTGKTRDGRRLYLVAIVLLLVGAAGLVGFGIMSAVGVGFWLAVGVGGIAVVYAAMASQRANALLSLVAIVSLFVGAVGLVGFAIMSAVGHAFPPTVRTWLAVGVGGIAIGLAVRWFTRQREASGPTRCGHCGYSW